MCGTKNGKSYLTSYKNDYTPNDFQFKAIKG